MNFTELEIERQRHANEVHELKQNYDLLHQDFIAAMEEITLRDQFAMAAMQGLIEKDLSGDRTDACCRRLADLSYYIADAMIAEREKALSVKPS